MTSEALTHDRFLDGRIVVAQPARGHHRSGLDAVLLAASVPARAAQRVFDFGAGAGVAGLCVAARVPGIALSLIENNPELCSLARDNLATNAALLAASRVVEDDVSHLGAAANASETADHVLMNPPFFEESTARPSPFAAKAAAHWRKDDGDDGLSLWVKSAARVLRPRGTLCVITPAAALPRLLAVMSPRFGALEVKAVFSRVGENAKRIVMRGKKGARTPLALTPPLIVHETATGAFTQAAEALLRNAALLFPH